MTGIPLVDLKAQYRAHREEFDRAVAECAESARFIGGEEHQAFAAEFADYCGGGHVALCGNGTDALTLAILGLLGPGDGRAEIITVSHTFIATVEAIVSAGYRPRLVDIDPATYCMDPASLAAAVGKDTRAVVPVHLYGRMAPMDAIMEIAGKNGLSVIEDAAQAHGAAWKGKGPGQWGDAACFSFYPGKNLGAWGDGGAVFTGNSALAARVAMHADHGRSGKYRHEFLAVNSRLDGLQAAILRVKLRHLDDWTVARNRVAAWYGERLAGLPGVTIPAADARGDARHVYHLYVVRLMGKDRDGVLEKLRRCGIGAGVHYPLPLHEQPALSHLGMAPGDLPHTHKAAGEIISLPMYPELTEDQVDRVAAALGKAVG